LVITIYSPCRGYSGDESNVGMLPSDTMLEIIETGHLHLELNVFEKDILKVKVEQDINFTVPEAMK
jgi:cobalt-zinc-cadmium efflux system membrane fusion protein